MKLAFLGQVLEKFSNTKFHENPSSGSQNVPCGRRDKHGEVNSRFFTILRARLKMGADGPSRQHTASVSLGDT
jgi:hypothetical protein